jgi:uncharacterized protein (DUF1015 family)
VASVPYDTVEVEEARCLAEGQPDSFLRVIRAEIELDPGADPRSGAVYARAARNYRRLLDDGVLVAEPRPAFFVYRQTMGAHVQRGVVCCCHVDDYRSGTIRRHEEVRPDKVADRLRLMEALGAQPGPVFLTYRGRPRIDGLVADAEREPPLFDFTAADGVAHAVWRVRETAPLAAALAELPAAYIADGHHRAEAAARLAAAAGPPPSDAPGSSSAWFLAVLFPAEQLRVLPYHRTVRDLNGMSPATFLAALRGRLTVTEDAPPEPPAPGRVSLRLGGRWYGLAFPAEAEGAGRFDSERLQEIVLGPILGIADPRTDDRIGFVGGIRGTGELERLVSTGQAAAGFALRAIGVEAMLSAADAGRTLPPKSTWFEPKLRSGLFVHAIDLPART